jgi:cell division septation protein DedD
MRHQFLGLVALCFLTVLAAMPSYSLAQQNAQPEGALRIENELLLDLRLEGQGLGINILGYQRGDEFLVSLSELVDGLQFPINTDADAGLAGGWFISEEREFILDLNAGRVISDGESYSPGSDVVVFEGDIFVTTSAIEDWFPLDLTPLIRQLSLNVEPLAPIPLQARLSRRDRRPGAPAIVSREAELPFQETPYRVIGRHATDIRLNVSSVLEDEEDTSTSMSGSYSVLSRGDLAWMTSTIAFTGSKDNEVSDGRFKLERSSLDGPLALDHIEIGDVDVSGSRGLQVRGGGAREGMTGLFADEAVDLRGDVPPGWEIELYRNGVLVDFQVVGGNAQYEFLDVPLEFGENRFEFVFYGPFGEERREERIYYAGRNSLGLGEVSYQLAAVQDGRSVFDVGARGSKGDVNSGRFLGDFNVGLASNAVASVGVDSYVSEEERLEDYRAGLSLNFARLQTSAGYQLRAQGPDQATALVRARVGGDTTSSFRYTRFITNGLDDGFIVADRQLWSSSVSVSSKILSLPFNLDALHSERDETSASAANVGTTYSTQSGVRFSKSFFYDREDTAEGADERTGGAVSVSTSLRPWRFRASIGYNIAPEADLQTINSSANLRIDSAMTMNFDVTHRAQSDYTTYRAGFNWLLDYVQISPQIVYDSNERWVGLISLSTSINPRPGRAMPAFDRLSQTGYGAVRARAFVDHDGSGSWSDGDEPLKNARIDAFQSWRNADTGADGNAYITRLGTARHTDVALDPGSLGDFELTPVSPGVSVAPRPGSWSTVEFPVIRAAELEGHIYMIPAPGAERVPGRRVLVELTDQSGEVVSKQRTAFDGFYVFASVPPGVYQLRLIDDLQERLGKQPGEVRVGASGGVIRNLDFIVSAPERRSLGDLSPPSEPPIRTPSPGFAPATEPPVFLKETREEAPVATPPTQIETRPAEQEPRTKAPLKPAEPAGDWHVQLGAFGEEGNASRRWQQLRAQGVLPAGMEPFYDRSGRFVLLFTSPGQTQAGARGLCERLKATDVDCLVKRFD